MDQTWINTLNQSLLHLFKFLFSCCSSLLNTQLRSLWPLCTHKLFELAKTLSVSKNLDIPASLTVSSSANTWIEPAQVKTLANIQKSVQTYKLVISTRQILEFFYNKENFQKKFDIVWTTLFRIRCLTFDYFWYHFYYIVCSSAVSVIHSHNQNLNILSSGGVFLLAQVHTIIPLSLKIVRYSQHKLWRYRFKWPLWIT